MINPTLNFVNDIHAEYCLPTGNVHGILKVGYQISLNARFAASYGIAWAADLQR